MDSAKTTINTLHLFLSPQEQYVLLWLQHLKEINTRARYKKNLFKKMNGHNMWGHSKRTELNSTESKVEIEHIK